MNKKITENSTLKEVLSVAGCEDILKKHNFPCIFCPFAFGEMEYLKLKDICRMYGIDKEKLLKDLNEKLKNKKSPRK